MKKILFAFFFAFLPCVMVLGNDFSSPSSEAKWRHEEFAEEYKQATGKEATLENLLRSLKTNAIKTNSFFEVYYAIKLFSLQYKQHLTYDNVLSECTRVNADNPSILLFCGSALLPGKHGIDILLSVALNKSDKRAFLLTRVLASQELVKNGDFRAAPVVFEGLFSGNKVIQSIAVDIYRELEKANGQEINGVKFDLQKLLRENNMDIEKIMRLKL